MFKKLSGIVAALAISVTTLIALPAHAAAPDEAPTWSYENGKITVTAPLDGSINYWKFSSEPAGLTCTPGMNDVECTFRDGWNPGTDYVFTYQTRTFGLIWSDPSPASTTWRAPALVGIIEEEVTLAAGVVGSPIEPNSAFVTYNFVGEVTYSISPTLPAGLSFDTSTGVISGTPTWTYDTYYTVTATGATSGTATAQVGVYVTAPEGWVPTPDPAGDGTVHYAFSLNAGGTKFTFNGHYLSSVSGVTVGGTSATKKLNSDGSLTVTIPAGTTGSADVVLSYGSGDYAGTLTAGTITYVGSAKLAQTITLNTGDQTFNLSDPVRAYSTTSKLADNSDTSLPVAVVSKTTAVCGIANGKVLFYSAKKCTITASQAGDGGTLAATAVTKDIFPIPAIASFDNLYSLDAGKGKLLIKGSGLMSVSKVYFGAVEVTGASAKSNADGTVLTVIVPAATGTANAGQSVDLKFDYIGHDGSVDTNHDFTYVGTTKWVQVVTAPTVSLPTTFTTSPTALNGSATKDSNALDQTITYKSLTPKVCSIVNGSLVYLTAGTCTFSTAQAGNAAVGAAKAAANTTVVIAKADQTLTVASPTLEITTQTPGNVGATLSSASAGVLVAYASSDETTCTVDGAGEVTGYKAGNCTITLTQAGDARFNAVAAPVTVAVAVTVDSTPNPTVGATVEVSQKQNISSHGIASYGYNNSGLLLAWDKALGVLKAKTFDTMIGYIHAKLTFTVDSVDYSCDVVFGNVKSMPVNTAVKKTAARAVKVAEAKSAFCADAMTMTVPEEGITTANFGKVKAVAKTKAAKAAEAIAAGKLKGYTGDITIEVTKYRAWASTMSNLRGDTKNGAIISATHVITTAALQ